jgi:inner membrane protein
MQGRQHFTLSLATAGVWVSPYLGEASTPTFLLLGGVALGSLIPDVDAKEAAIFNNQRTPLHPTLDYLFRISVGWLLPLFGYLTKYLVFKPSLIFFRTILPCVRINGSHRGFAHSLLGIFSFTACMALYLWLFVRLLEVSSITALAPFLGGYLAGAFLHLVQDSCTPQGIAWGHPFTKVKLRGEIEVTKSTLRPALLFYGMVVLGVGVFYWPSLGSPWLPTSIAIGATLTLWLLFMIVTGVYVSRT